MTAVMETIPTDCAADAGRLLALKGIAQLIAADWRDAIPTLRAAIALGDRSPSTVLNLAIALDRDGELLIGRAMMRSLIDTQPEWDEPALRLAESLRRNSANAEAELAYRLTIARNPHRAEALIGLAVILLTRGGDAAAEAQMLLLQCCALHPDRAEAWDALGIALARSGECSKAEAAFARAQLCDPQNTAIAMRRAEVSVVAGSADVELARLEAACITDPLNAAFLTERGVLMLHLGQTDQAIELLQAAVVLAPQDAITAATLANGLIAANRVNEALPALTHAIVLAPDDTSLRNNRSAVLVRLHRYREAQEELNSLIAEYGEEVGTLCNLTNALVSVGAQDAALAVARRAVELDPSGHLAWRTMSNVLAYHPEVSAMWLLDVNRRASAALRRGKRLDFVARRPDKRLRIGLLSAMLKRHPVGWLTIEGFENLDPTEFEIVCLSQTISDDMIQRRFRSVASEWHVVEGLAHAEAVAQIGALGLDILIDLGGYGDRGMMGWCAERLAPIQIKWVGAQSHSTGLAEMDWFLTDQWETPLGWEEFYSERLLRLPNGYVCYSPPSYSPDVVTLPALRRGQITFGCFNNLAKITPVVVQTWCRILARIPQARLILKAHQLADHQTALALRTAFVQAGLDPERLELRGGSNHRALLAEYGDIDIVLDPFPYGGGLTTCEALWMGVPTITCSGETFASRHSTSHMSNVGLTDWVASDLDGYCALAISKAADKNALADLRAGLRHRVRTSPLCDGPRFGADLGNALRQTWQSWCVEGPISACKA